MKQTRDTKNSAFHRAVILSLIGEEGSKTISELSTYLKISRPAIYGHLDTLEEKGLIKREKDTSKKGAPVIISNTKKANPLPLKELKLAQKLWQKATSLI